MEDFSLINFKGQFSTIKHLIKIIMLQFDWNFKSHAVYQYSMPNAN